MYHFYVGNVYSVHAFFTADRTAVYALKLLSAFVSTNRSSVQPLLNIFEVI